MPFLDNRQAESRANLPAAEYKPEVSWWDGYAASLGMVIDEEMTISQGLNRQGWSERRRKVQDLDIDLQPFTDRRGRVDYDAISREFEGVKTDAQLKAERNQMLASRRAYAQETLENAPASAQFLGAMSGYLLDPLSIATMPISYTVKGAQGLSILSRIGQTAARAAVVEGTTELAIQSIVFDYKKDIDSPYSARDAITAIATAAAGAAALGGATEGISGYLKSIRQSVDPSTLNRGELKAYESVLRMEEALEGVPVERQEAVLREMDTFTESYNSRTLEPLTAPRNALEEAGFTLVSVGDEGLTGRGAIKLKDGTVVIDDSPVHAVQINRLNDAGIPTSEIESGGFIRADGSYIEGSADTPRIIEQDKARLAVEAKIAASQGPSTSIKESEVLQRTGLSEAYDQTVADYSKLENRVIFDGENAVNADDLLKEFDDELNGLDNVIRCVNG